MVMFIFFLLYKEKYEFNHILLYERYDMNLILLRYV